MTPPLATTAPSNQPPSGLIRHQLALVRTVTWLVLIINVCLGTYSFHYNITVDPPFAFTHLVRDVGLGIACIAALVFLPRNFGYACRALLAGLIFYLAWHYVSNDMRDLPSALLPLLIMIIAAYTMGRRALWWVTGMIVAAVLGSVVNQFLFDGLESIREPTYIVALCKQLFQVPLAACLVDRTIVVLHNAMEAADLRRAESEELHRQLADQMNHTMDLQQRLNRTAAHDAAVSVSAAISHDFGNLLNAIEGYANLAWESVVTMDTPLTRALDGIERAVEKALRLNRQVMDMMRNEAREPYPINLDAAMVEIAPLLKVTVGKQINVEVDMENVPPVLFDEPQLALILLNLAANARDAMEGRGTLSLRAQERDDAVVVTISDTGPGMDTDKAKHAFQPFWTTKQQGKGTGLGLFSARQMAESMHARLALCANAGNGAQFELALQRA
ncbi:HAMP domain-containing histidine kinase [Luteibacter flocculans]|uniref:histidine kinase n=1 Tax=Luteibacter flocculans TaxID=2780091 RepID=A0ABY4SXW6_9GAMM|nr:HAMP domain-containing sensor histidine kinase [Luteibacter flocculans]URL57096.1 HAMP domain-containing histidine kinase [Luteibacter flocculans]